MNIIIFGASGMTGQQLVRQALKKDFRVTAFVRNPEKLPLTHANLLVVRGDVINEKDVQAALKGHDAVLCALGAKTPFKNDHSITEGIKNIVSAMALNHIDRFIYLSFMAVREHRKELGLIIHHIMPIIMKKVIEDHEAKEKIITGSGLKWTIVRAPKLTNGAPVGIYRHGEHILPKSPILKISRADLAAFMLAEISGNRYIRQKPRIMY
jgi:putative NADH-flavin reductase